MWSWPRVVAIAIFSTGSLISAALHNSELAAYFAASAATLAVTGNSNPPKNQNPRNRKITPIEMPPGPGG